MSNRAFGVRVSEQRTRYWQSCEEIEDRLMMPVLQPFECIIAIAQLTQPFALLVLATSRTMVHDPAATPMQHSFHLSIIPPQFPLVVESLTV